MQEAMAEASRTVLGGLELGTDASVVRYPDRYADSRGEVMWDRVTRLIGRERPCDRNRAGEDGNGREDTSPPVGQGSGETSPRTGMFCPTRGDTSSIL